MDFDLWIYLWIGLAVVLLPVQLFVTPPYGRHTSTTWGPTLDNRLAWVCMELVALAGLWATLLGFAQTLSPVAWVACLLWSLHYVNRALVYPLRTRTAGKRMPLLVMLLALLFNGVNSVANGAYLATGALQSGAPSLLDARTICGVLLFLAGWIINVTADNTLLKLRRRGEQGYKVPYGGLFERVSCPNFLGEIIEWIGFAVLCWNPAALAFALWTSANLAPRALAHHRWYRAEFADYPPQRKALVPYVL